MPPKKGFIPRDYKKEWDDYINICAINQYKLVDWKDLMFLDKNNVNHYLNGAEASDELIRILTPETKQILIDLQEQEKTREMFVRH